MRSPILRSLLASEQVAKLFDGQARFAENSGKECLLNGFPSVHGDDDAHFPLRMYEDEMATLLAVS